MGIKKTFLLMTIFLLTGCNIFPGGESKSSSLEAGLNNLNSKDPVMINVDLPVQKLVITSGNDKHELEVEIASTDAQRKIGLMNRKDLAENSGMLFVFQSQGYVNFWMKNTLIPLDMIFINDLGVIQHIEKSAQPCSARRDSDCPKYNSEKPVKYVLEVRGGRADQLGIRTGDSVTWL